MAASHAKHHDYHLVNPSPWPIVGAVSAFVLAVSAINWMHGAGWGTWGMLIGITGVLYTKDIIHLMIDAGPIILHDLVRPAMFVPDSMPIAQVLNRFQAEHIDFAAREDTAWIKQLHLLLCQVYFPCLHFH